MTDRTATAGPTHTLAPQGRGRRTAVAGLLALALLGTTAATSPGALAAPRPAAATATASAHTTDLGFLTRISRTSRGTRLTFDRAILHTGAAAAAQRQRRGLDPTPDFYVQNDNRWLLRTRTVAPGVVVVGSQQLTGSPAPKRTSLDRLRRYLAARPQGQPGALFRLTLDRRGKVVRIAEVYLP